MKFEATLPRMRLGMPKPLRGAGAHRQHRDVPQAPGEEEVQRPGPGVAGSDEHDEVEEEVGGRVEQGAEPRHLVPFAGEVAVEVVGQPGGDAERDGDDRMAEVEDADGDADPHHAVEAEEVRQPLHVGPERLATGHWFVPLAPRAYTVSRGGSGSVLARNSGRVGRERRGRRRPPSLARPRAVGRRHRGRPSAAGPSHDLTRAAGGEQPCAREVGRHAGNG